jgi:hypothetical protein
VETKQPPAAARLRLKNLKDAWSASACCRTGAIAHGAGAAFRCTLQDQAALESDSKSLIKNVSTSS